MKIFNVTGISRSGKTTSIENIIEELSSRGYTVGTIKSIGCGKHCARRQTGDCSCKDQNDSFSVDTKGKNSWRHRLAGAQVISTWAESETAIIFPKKLSDEDLLKHYALARVDYVIIEGYRKASYPRIVSAHTIVDARNRMNDQTFAVIGKVSKDLAEIDDIPCINALSAIHQLCDLIETHAEEYKSHR